jgi:hypothetical protein
VLGTESKTRKFVSERDKMDRRDRIFWTSNRSVVGMSLGDWQGLILGAVVVFIIGLILGGLLFVPLVTLAVAS